MTLRLMDVISMSRGRPHNERHSSVDVGECRRVSASGQLSVGQLDALRLRALDLNAECGQIGVDNVQKSFRLYFTLLKVKSLLTYSLLWFYDP